MSKSEFPYAQDIVQRVLEGNYVDDTKPTPRDVRRFHESEKQTKEWKRKLRKKKSKYAFLLGKEYGSKFSCCCIHRVCCCRYLLYLIVTSLPFDFLVCLIILINLVCMILQPPVAKKDEKKLLFDTTQYLNLFFLFLYTIELSLKIFVFGITVHHRILSSFPCLSSLPFLKKGKSGGFFERSVWNFFDFFVIMLGWISIACFLIFDLDYVWNITILRGFSILQIFLQLDCLGEIKAIVDTIGRSFSLVKDVILLFIFLIFVFSIFGMEIFMNSLQRRCLLFNETSSTYDIETIPTTFCKKLGNDNSRSNVLHHCPHQNMSCVLTGENILHYGVTNFDNFLNSFLTLFQAKSLTGWASEIMLSYVEAENLFVSIFFTFYVFTVTFVVLNLFMAILSSTFMNIREEQQEEKRRRICFCCRIPSYLSPIWGMVKGRVYEGWAVLWDGAQASWCCFCCFAFPGCFCCCEAMSRFINSCPYETISVLIVACHVFIQSTVYGGMSDFHKDFIDISSIFFLSIYIIDVLFLRFAIGSKLNPYSYFIGSGGENGFFNFLDIFLISISTITIVLKYSIPGSQSFCLYKLSFLRILRIFKILKTIPVCGGSQISKLVKNVAKSFMPVFNTFCLVLYCIFIFAIIGYQLFSGRLKEPPTYESIDDNYDNVGNAMITLFKIMTADSWYNSFYVSTHLVSKASAILFFVIYYVLSVYVFMSLFTAVILENFGEESNQRQEEEKKQPRIIRRICCYFRMSKKLRICGLETFHFLKSKIQGRGSMKDKTVVDRLVPDEDFDSSYMNISEKENCMDSKDLAEFRNAIYQNKLEEIKSFRNVIDNSMKKRHWRYKDPFWKKNRKIEVTLNFSKHIFRVLKYLNRIRICICLRCFKRPLFTLFFQLFIGSVIVLSMVLSILQPSKPAVHPVDEKTQGSTHLFYLYGEIVVFSIYTIEIMFNCLLFRPCHLFFLLFVYTVSFSGFFLVFQYPQYSFFRLMNQFKLFRVFELMMMKKGLRKMLLSLIYSIPSLIGVIIFSSFVLFLFSVSGTILFSQKFHVCNDPAISSQENCTGLYLNHHGVLGPRVWDVRRRNFDDVSKSFLTLMEIMTYSDWAAIMYQAMGISYQYFLYFILFVVFGGFFIVNLLVGILLDKFEKKKNETDEKLLLKEKQIEWLEIERNIMETKPAMRMKNSGRRRRKTWYELNLKYRKIFQVMFSFLRVFRWMCCCISYFCCSCCYIRTCFRRIINSHCFRCFIVLCILLHVGVMCTKHSQQTESWEILQKSCSVLFTLIFCTEIVLKIFSLGICRFTCRKKKLLVWNFFDFILCILLLLSSIFECAINDNSHLEKEYPTLLLLLRTFTRTSKVLKIFSIIPYFEGLKTLFHSLIASLPKLVDTFLLLLALFFVYICIGMQVFGQVKYGKFVRKFVNFRTFFVSSLTLTRISTMDAWNDIMGELLISNSRKCTKEIMFLDGREVYLDDCGPGDLITYLYFISFYVIGAYVILNIFVAVVIGNFSHFFMVEENEVEVFTSPSSKYQRKMFQVYWNKISGKEYLDSDIQLSVLVQLLYEDKNSVLGFPIPRNKLKFQVLKDLIVVRHHQQKKKNEEKDEEYGIRKYYFHDVLICLILLRERSEDYLSPKALEDRKERLKIAVISSHLKFLLRKMEDHQNFKNMKNIGSRKEEEGEKEDLKDCLEYEDYMVDIPSPCESPKLLSDSDEKERIKTFSDQDGKIEIETIGGSINYLTVVRCVKDKSDENSSENSSFDIVEECSETEEQEEEEEQGSISELEENDVSEDEEIIMTNLEEVEKQKLEIEEIKDDETKEVTEEEETGKIKNGEEENKNSIPIVCVENNEEEEDPIIVQNEDNKNMKNRRRRRICKSSSATKSSRGRRRRRRSFRGRRRGRGKRLNTASRIEFLSDYERENDEGPVSIGDIKPHVFSFRNSKEDLEKLKEGRFWTPDGNKRREVRRRRRITTSVGSWSQQGRKRGKRRRRTIVGKDMNVRLVQTSHERRRRRRRTRVEEIRKGESEEEDL